MLVFDSKESILQSRRSRNHSSGWGWETAPVQGFERREESAAHMLESHRQQSYIWQNVISHPNFGKARKRAHRAHRDEWKNENLKRAHTEWKNAN
jgi:hypothetical protein